MITNLKKYNPRNILFPSMEAAIGPDSRFAELEKFLSSRRKYSLRDARAGFYTLGCAANYVLSYNSALLSISNSIINTYWRGRKKPA